MNAVEIEEAISALAAEPFVAETFPFQFLEAFGNKKTTIKRLRSGAPELIFPQSVKLKKTAKTMK